ncbi:hypothetical protein D3C78_1119590 [compost metagenome]
MPMAANMPWITAPGISAASLPPRSRPKASCSMPANSRANKKVEKSPSVNMAPVTMVTSPAAGPLTEKGEGLSRVTTIPPITPVNRPTNGGTPLACAMPRLSGRATRNTTSPAGRSKRRSARFMSPSLQRCAVPVRLRSRYACRKYNRPALTRHCVARRVVLTGFC